MRNVFFLVMFVQVLGLQGQPSQNVLRISDIDFPRDESLSLTKYISGLESHEADSTDAVFGRYFVDAEDNFDGQYFRLVLAGDKVSRDLVVVFDPNIRRLLLVKSNQHGEVEIFKSGTTAWPGESAYKTSAVNAIPLTIQANEDVVLDLKIDEPVEMDDLGEIKAYDRFEKRVNRRLRVSYIFATILFTFAIYNFLLALLVRKTVYFYYSYYVFAFGFYASIIALTLLFPMSIVAPVSVISAIVLISAGAWFSGEFLAVGDYLNRTKYYYKFLQYSAFFIAPVLLINLITFNNTTFSNVLAIGTAFIGLSTVPFWLWVGFRIHRKGNPNGRLFLLTNIPLLLGCCIFIMIWLMDHLGFISVSSHLAWVTNMILFGSVLFQLLLFSYVIGYSIKKLQGEKLQIQQEINQKLEAEVADRTASLKAANESIEQQKSELAELNKVKDNLFSIVSHDLRNPLNSVKGVLELINKGAVQGKDLQLIASKLESSLDGTMNLLDNLLYWAKSQMDGIQAQPRLIKPKDIIENNLKLALTLFKEKDLEVKTDLTEAQALADEDMIDLVVRNLLSNAIKFTPSKGEIHLKMWEEGHQVVFSMKDNGIGMSKKDLNELFSPEKSHTSYGTNNEKGYGLGLKLCRDFIEINGGSLKVRSEENKGSTFTVSLPTEA